jgi:hypothetical protein
MACHPSPQRQPEPCAQHCDEAAEPFAIAAEPFAPEEAGPQPAATETLAIKVAQPRPQLATTKQVAQSRLQARTPQSLSIEVKVEVATQARGDRIRVARARSRNVGRQPTRLLRGADAVSASQPATARVLVPSDPLSVAQPRLQARTARSQSLSVEVEVEIKVFVALLKVEIERIQVAYLAKPGETRRRWVGQERALEVAISQLFAAGTPRRLHTQAKQAQSQPQPQPQSEPQSRPVPKAQPSTPLRQEPEPKPKSQPEPKPREEANAFGGESERVGGFALPCCRQQSRRQRRAVAP